jgi:hypothetical protein
MSINDAQEQTHRRTQKIAHVTYFGNSMISLEDFALAPFFFHSGYTQTAFSQGGGPCEGFERRRRPVDHG